MWLQYHQSLLTELFQAALVKLCLENVPFSGNLELDGLFCISNGDVSKQIVVKIHKVIQPTSSNQGKSRSILKINQTSQDSDEHTRQNDTALVVEVRRGKIGEGIMSRSEHSGNISNSTKDFSIASRKDEKSAKTDSVMLVEIPSNLTTSSKKSGSGVVAVDLSLSSPSAQDSTNSVRISDLKEEQISTCDEDSIGEPLQVQDYSDIHNGLKCKHCQLNFNDLNDLETHLRENHGRFMCRQCLTTFSLSCNLRRHMKLHTGVRPHVCGSCNSSFSRSTDLKIHMRKHSSSKDSFSCSVCSVIFSNSYLLFQHMTKVHGVVEESFKCETCKKQFSSESNLKLHQKVHRESYGSEAGMGISDRRPNIGDEQDTMNAGDEDEMSFEDGSGSNCSESPGPRLPSSWMTHSSEKVQQTKEMELQVESEENQNLPLDFKIKSVPNELGKRISDSYLETVKEFAPLFTLGDSDEANGSCSRDFLVKSSENVPRALSLVQKQLSFSAPTAGKNKRKGMPVKHIKVNENGSYYEISDDQVLHDNNNSDEEGDDVANGDTASNCAGVICKTLAYNEDVMHDDKLRLNQKPVHSSRDGLKDEELTACKLRSSAFLLPRNEVKTDIKLEKQEVYSVSSDLSLNNNEAENRVFTCRHGGCSTSWFGFAAYESHYISAHCRYPCELCDQSFTSRNNRRRHANGHGNVKKHNCDQCDKLFARPDIVKEHRITHTRSYQTGSCFKCDFACVKKTMLLSHLKRCLTVEDVDSDISKH